MRYLQEAGGQQSLDDGPGLALVPAHHTAEDAQGGKQVLGAYQLDLACGDADALAAEGSDGSCVDAVAKVTSQSCRNLQ